MVRQCSRNAVSTSADWIEIWEGHESRFLSLDIHRPRSLVSNNAVVLASSKLLLAVTDSGCLLVTAATAGLRSLTAADVTMLDGFQTVGIYFDYLVQLSMRACQER